MGLPLGQILPHLHLTEVTSAARQSSLAIIVCLIYLSFRHLFGLPNLAAEAIALRCLIAEAMTFIPVSQTLSALGISGVAAYILYHAVADTKLFGGVRQDEMPSRSGAHRVAQAQRFFRAVCASISLLHASSCHCT